jgi:hypothetical protein
MADSGLKVLVYGAGGVVLGAFGTILVQRLLPEPKPGDGFTVRWLDKDGNEKRVDFGDNERTALERAVSLASQYSGVEIIEIRQGRVARVQAAGQTQREVL